MLDNSCPAQQASGVTAAQPEPPTTGIQGPGAGLQIGLGMTRSTCTALLALFMAFSLPGVGSAQSAPHPGAPGHRAPDATAGWREAGPDDRRSPRRRGYGTIGCPRPGGGSPRRRTSLSRGEKAARTSSGRSCTRAWASSGPVSWSPPGGWTVAASSSPVHSISGSPRTSRRPSTTGPWKKSYATWCTSFAPSGPMSSWRSFRAHREMVTVSIRSPVWPPRRPLQPPATRPASPSWRRREWSHGRLPSCSVRRAFRLRTPRHRWKPAGWIPSWVAPTSRSPWRVGVSTAPRTWA